MQHTTPYDMAKSIERALTSVLSGIDAANLDPGPGSIVGALKRQATDVRLEVRDYELAETRAEQLEHAHDGRKRLEDLRKHILAASEHDLFSAIDVAHISAHIDRLIGDLV